MNSAKTKRINIAKDFSPFPAGRYVDDGPYNGTTFRQDHLVPALREFAHVEVDFDGVAGFGSSFLEEAFGGLIRSENMSKAELDARLAISTTEPDLTDDVELTKRYIADEAARQ